MKSFYYLLGAAAIALASCSESTELETNPINNLAAKGTAVSFGSYQAKATRAGATGSITTEVLKGADYGFGVFAHSTGTANYNDATTTPNFMWNQKVTYNKSGAADETGNVPEWIYSPVKFWPNANTAADDANAVGTPASSKISFFAYAPYVGNETTGVLENPGTSGITAISANNTAGNPTVTYTLATTGKTVDLLWGTCAADAAYQSVDGTTTLSGGVATNALNDIKTNLDITKLKTGQKIKFNFKHALAKIGGSNELGTDGKPVSDKQSGLMVQLDIDKSGAISGGTKPEATKVTIKTIKIENNKGAEDYNGNGTPNEAGDKILNKGTLDLATGKWVVDANAEAAKIDHEITSDASSAAEKTASAATIATNLAEPATVAKTEAGFNGLVAGVQTTPLNVYGTESNPLVFIPGTAPSFKVTIEYVVRTKDAHLANAYTEAVQTISKMVSFPNVELNKKYNLIMHLGLTSIKFTATVEDWENTGTATSTTTTAYYKFNGTSWEAYTLADGESETGSAASVAELPSDANTGDIYKIETTTSTEDGLQVDLPINVADATPAP